MKTNDKPAILQALRAFVQKRPGFDPANYGFDAAGRSAYRSDSRRATRDMNHALDLLRAIEWRDRIDAQDILDAARGGRLDLVRCADGSYRVDYTTGQYWCTEYRAAVCGLAVSVLWRRFRTLPGVETADDVRRMARRELGRSLARRFL